jgi:hypothetical protein
LLKINVSRPLSEKVHICTADKVQKEVVTIFMQATDQHAERHHPEPISKSLVYPCNMSLSVDWHFVKRQLPIACIVTESHMHQENKHCRPYSKQPYGVYKSNIDGK